MPGGKGRIDTVRFPVTPLDPLSLGRVGLTRSKFPYFPGLATRLNSQRQGLLPKETASMAEPNQTYLASLAEAEA